MKNHNTLAKVLSKGSMSLIACTLVVSSAWAVPAAFPTDGVIASGSATISGTTTMTVAQTTQNAIINWSDFSVASGNSVAFTGGNATLNRVTTANPSVIAGTVTGDHALFFINPNGILVSGTMTAPTLVLSTLGITDTDFNNGNYTFNRGGATGAITNNGVITDGYVAGSIGVAALFAATVTNSGVNDEGGAHGIIEAHNVTIVAAESVKLNATTANVAGGVYDAASNGYSGVSGITASAVSTSITNSHSLLALGNGGDSGKVDIYSTNGMIDNTGGWIGSEIYSGASSAVTLTASGDILNSGWIDTYTGAIGAAAGAVTLTAGGTIDNRGGYIGSNSNTGASGAVTLTAGGTIDLRNQGSIQSSSILVGMTGDVTLTAPSLLYTTYADALGAGNVNLKTNVRSHKVANGVVTNGAIRLRADTVNGAAMSTLSAADFEQTLLGTGNYVWFGDLAFEPITVPEGTTQSTISSIANLTGTIASNINAGSTGSNTTTTRGTSSESSGESAFAQNAEKSEAKGAPEFAGQTHFTVGRDITGGENREARGTIIPGVFVVSR